MGRGRRGTRPVVGVDGRLDAALLRTADGRHDGFNLGVVADLHGDRRLPGLLADVHLAGLRVAPHEHALDGFRTTLGSHGHEIAVAHLLGTLAVADEGGIPLIALKEVS